jgi:nitrite reductase/ring-hydroxylating ferredoxin subunit
MQADNGVPRAQGSVLCRFDAIPDAGAIEVHTDKDSLVLLRYGEHVYGYLNVCPHAGRPLNYAPGKFLLMHGQLVCASHGAAFKPEDGLCIGGPCRGQSLVAVPLLVRDAMVELAPPSNAV